MGQAKGLIMSAVVAFAVIAITARVQMLRNLAGL
jgi:hypothetical protein